MADVFISYSRKDTEVARRIRRDLEDYGIDVFLDTARLKAGEDFASELDKAAKSAKVILGLWSNHSLSSQWVLNECREGKSRDRLVPVSIDVLDSVPVEFNGLHYLSLLSEDAENYEENWKALLSRISELLDRPEIAAEKIAHYQTVRVLVLDDNPGQVRKSSNKMMKALRAEKVKSFSESADARRLKGKEEAFLWPVSLGEMVCVQFTFCGTDKSLILEVVNDSKFLQKFHIINVDRMWNEMNVPFEPSDFGLLAREFEQGGDQDVGLVLIKLLSFYSHHEPFLIVNSQQLPEPEKIRAAQEAGAVQFMNKDDHIQFCNVLLLAIRKLNEQRDAGSGRTSSNKDFVDYIGGHAFGNDTLQARLLSALARIFPGEISKNELIVSAGAAPEKLAGNFADCFEDVAFYIRKGGYSVEIKDDMVFVGV
jgi:hypothetical protein